VNLGSLCGFVLPAGDEVEPEYPAGVFEQRSGVVGFEDEGAEEVDAHGDADAGVGFGGELEAAFAGFDGAQFAVFIPGQAGIGKEGELCEEVARFDERQLLGAGEGQADFGIGEEDFAAEEAFYRELIGRQQLAGGVKTIAAQVPGIAEEKRIKHFAVPAIAAVVDDASGQSYGFEEDVFSEVCRQGGEVEGQIGVESGQVLLDAYAEAIAGHGRCHAEIGVVSDEGRVEGGYLTFEEVEAAFLHIEFFAVLVEELAEGIVVVVVSDEAVVVEGVGCAGFPAEGL